MPGHMQSETRALKDPHHNIGPMSIPDHARLANQLASHEAIDDLTREYGLSKTYIDLSVAPASHLSAPSTVAKAEALENAEIWRGLKEG